MDRIVLHGVRCRMRVGVSPEERAEPQECLVDVELGRDLAPAGCSDDLQHSIDYEHVFHAVHRVAAGGTYKLLERFAAALEKELQSALQYEDLVIRVKKTHPPLSGPVDFAGIEWRRT